jgi:hypothetical protein
MMRTKNLLTLTVLLLFMFLTQINTYADVAPFPPRPPRPPIPVEGGVSMLFIGITVAVIALIAFFIIRHIRKDKLKA